MVGSKRRALTADDLMRMQEGPQRKRLKYDDSDEEEKKEDEEQPIATTVLCSLTPGKVRIVITPGNKHENNACLLD